MPVTPFHLGPGLLVKALAPGRVSLAAFALANAVIDAESVANLLLGRWPVHAVLHSVPGAVLAGALSGLAVWRLGPRRWGSEEVGLGAALVGGLLGGLGQTGLDAVMHADLRPLWPVSGANPLLGAVGLEALHGACVLAGLVGAVAWAVRAG